MHHLFSLLTNPYFITATSSWFVAQVFKLIIHAIIHKKIEWERLFGDGGMPSGHSATVSSLAMITGLHYGLGSFEFALAAILAIIVCHDATGVRWETGKQAVVINEIVRLFETLSKKDLPETKLKEFVGHSPIQVAAGITLGIANAFVMYYILF